MAIGYLRLSMSRKESSNSMAMIIMLVVACLSMTAGGFLAYRTLKQSEEDQKSRNQQLQNQQQAVVETLTQFSSDLGASGF